MWLFKNCSTGILNHTRYSMLYQHWEKNHKYKQSNQKKQLFVTHKIITIGSNSQKLAETVETVLIGLFVTNQHHNKLWC